jgi:hypothetical protein
MKLIEINWQPSDRQLRQFGWIALAALPAMGWCWNAGSLGIGWLAGIGAALAGWGTLFPRSLRPLFIGLSLVTFPIGMLVSELALLVLFYGAFLPIGLIVRWTGRDLLQRQFEPSADSYWQPRKQAADAASYFRRW